MYAVPNPYGSLLTHLGTELGHSMDKEQIGKPVDQPGLCPRNLPWHNGPTGLLNTEALGVIKALMKWEDKLVGRQFIIVTDHEALETIKMSNRDGKSGRLIHWDEYLSRFKYEVMHVPGVCNKVADCLSRYYENDRYDEVHESHRERANIKRAHDAINEARVST